ncbi:DUF3047 domain-containing protein [bacterium]|nr:DUF3047 domain-containing protein [bacterium]
MLKIFALTTIIFSIIICSVVSAQEPSTIDSSIKIIENFQKQKENKFPDNWHAWPFRKKNAKSVYTVQKEGENLYLQADDNQNISEQIFNRFYWEVEKYPYLTFKWRARILPKDANESDAKVNDSACGIYIVIEKYRGKAIKYVWSTTLPVGTIYEKREDKMYMKVMDSGTANLNKWVTHTVNVKEDYKKVFKEDLKKPPSGIGILTDANATETHAKCDYDDFIISAKPTK